MEIFNHSRSIDVINIFNLREMEEEEPSLDNLVRAINGADWETASILIQSLSPADLATQIPPTMDTVLHLAIAFSERLGNGLALDLIERIPLEALLYTNILGKTPLDVAVDQGSDWVISAYRDRLNSEI